MPTSYDSQTLHNLIEAINLIYDSTGVNYEDITNDFRAIGGPAAGLAIDGRSFMERHYKEYIMTYENIDNPDPKSPALDAFLSTFKHAS